MELYSLHLRFFRTSYPDVHLMLRQQMPNAGMLAIACVVLSLTVWFFVALCLSAALGSAAIRSLCWLCLYVLCPGSGRVSDWVPRGIQSFSRRLGLRRLG